MEKITKITIGINPKPQSRTRSNFKTGHVYEKSDMKIYKNQIRLCVSEYKREMIVDGAIRFNVTFYIDPPQYIKNLKKNADKLKQEVMSVHKKPDIDNYFKALTDACEGILYTNDSQIAEVTMKKVYSLNPRIEIKMEEI
jgi:Holliday junction resolvase RusA-like endonuclease